MKRKKRQPLARVELVLVPARGKSRVFTISPLTIGVQNFQLYAAFVEQALKLVEKKRPGAVFPYKRRTISGLFE